jgi:CBS domain-containing protein
MANYDLRARDIMQVEIASVPPETTVLQAALRMKREGVRSLIVERANPDDAFGIVTYSDIVSKVLAWGMEPGEVTVEEIMVKPLVVVNPNLKVEHVARLFAQTGIGHAPVISEHRLVGVISKTDLIVEVVTEE